MGDPIDGHAIAAAILEELAPSRAALPVAPRLVALRIGEGPTELDALGRQADAWGVRIETEAHPATVRPGSLERSLKRLAHDPSVHGVMLVGTFDRRPATRRLRLLVPPDKDVAALHPETTVRWLDGRAGPVPPLADAVRRMGLATLDDPERRTAVLAVGPGRDRWTLAAGLGRLGVDVRVCPSGPPWPKSDLLVVGGGKAESIGANAVLPGQVVLDLGVHASVASGEVRLVGDVRYDEVLGRARHVTPVPGGVGPVRDAVLLANVWKAAAAPAGGGQSLPLFD